IDLPKSSRSAHLSLRSLFSPGLFEPPPPFLHLLHPARIYYLPLTLVLCFFFFLPSPLSVSSWAAELTAHLALAHRALSEPERSIVTNTAHGSNIKTIRHGCRQTVCSAHVPALHVLCRE
uniref:Uncharacterized protein n=1 Tax=Oryzias melastigma TaxID=30732 RepID=A0A3B3D592_ORYME